MSKIGFFFKSMEKTYFFTSLLTCSQNYLHFFKNGHFIFFPNICVDNEKGKKGKSFIPKIFVINSWNKIDVNNKYICD